MSWTASALATVDPAPNTLSEATLRRLRADILLRRFSPGQRLMVAELRLAYGVSGTVVREALCRLAAGGFVIGEGQRGFRVAEVSEQDLLDLTKTRIWVEGIALRSAIMFGDRNWEAEILAAAHRLGDVQPWRNPDNSPDLDDRWVAAHRGYHQVLVSACRSPQLLSYRALLHDLSDRYKRLSGMKRDRDLVAEHRALTEAVLDRDADRACTCIEEHFLSTAAASLAQIVNTTSDVEQLLERLRSDIRTGMPTTIAAQGSP